MFVNSSAVSCNVSVNKLWPAFVDKPSVPFNNNLLIELPFTTWGIPVVGAVVNVNVAPLILHTVSPALSVEFNNTPSRYILISSVLAFKDVRVNSVVEEFGVMFSWIKLPSSKIISNGTSEESVPASNVIVSVVISESSRVPASCKIPPPIILTTPVATLMSVSFESEVNDTTSPTSYRLPPSSTITSLTDPVEMSSTTTSDTPEPRLSILRVSDILFSIPSFVTADVVIWDDTVNVTSTSLVVDVPVIVSPSVNVPTIFCNSNSVTAKFPCVKVDEDTTTAVAPDDTPVITWLITSEPSTLAAAETLSVTFWPQLPSEVLITFSVG